MCIWINFLLVVIIECVGTEVQIKIFAPLCLESETDPGIVMSCC